MERTDAVMADAEFKKRYNKAKAGGDYSKALEILENIISDEREDRDTSRLRLEQGSLFINLVKKTQNRDMAVTYLLGALGCVTKDAKVTLLSTRLLKKLGVYLGSVFYFKKCVRAGREGLASPDPLKDEYKEDFESVIKEAELMIAESKTRSVVVNHFPETFDSRNGLEPRREDRVRRSYWMGLDVKVKRDFMKVSIAKLTSFVKGEYNKEGLQVLEKVLAYARKHEKWTSWVCRTKCFVDFSSDEECRTHLEKKHGADFKPSSEEDVINRLGRKWAHKIKVGGWEPVDTVVVVEMINTKLEDVKAFTTTESKKKGWSNKWPFVTDEKRSSLLKEIKLLLVSLCEHQILSCSIRDWVMRFPVRHLRKLEVSEESINDCHIVEIPQSICFLERDELEQIRDFLKKIKFKCERHDGTDQVCRAVDSLLDSIQIKEKLDFNAHFSLLLLDKRLLKSNIASFNDEGKINLIDDPDVHYAKAQAQGDDIISWLGDCSSVDKTVPKPIREHNLVIWVAVLRAVQYTCRALGSKYAKKRKVLDYEAALTFVEKLCMLEDERNSYASLLCKRSEERLPANSPTTRLFLCAVRDVLHGALHPTVDVPDLEDCMNLIRQHKNLGNDIVLSSIDILKSVVTEKVLLIDAKILLIDNSRIRLLDKLTGLSAFDNRSYMLHFLKPFLLNEIKLMESKVKSDAEAILLLKEGKKSLKGETKSQAKKAKNAKSSKITSTNMASFVDKTVEHESSMDLERGSTSRSPETMEEVSMEPEDTLTTQKGPLEISSNTDIREEATKIDCDDSLSGHLQSALGGAPARYNSALDMTLKALMNINVLKEDLKYNKQPFHDNLEERVPCSLQSLFTDVVSGEIKTEGVYRFTLRQLLTSLEEVNSMPSYVAEVLVRILESWHCWKNSEGESLVNRLLTLEENERMSCRNCGRKTNYPEQSSYGIVIGADSIRDLKCAFGNMKFVDILKVMRMKYKMLCDIKSGGCGKTNFVHHVITRCPPPIFIIVLEWEKSETEEEITETTKALEWEIDISRLYEGLDQNTNYRLVSMVGYGEEEREHICMAYEKNRWVNLTRQSLAGKVVGNSWKNVVRSCGVKKVRPVILLYEAAARSMMA